MPAANIVGLGSFYNPETKRTYWAMEIAVKSPERKTVRYEKERERKPARHEKVKITPTKSRSILSLLPSWLKF
jgi:hypothetical protein